MIADNTPRANTFLGSRERKTALYNMRLVWLEQLGTSMCSHQFLFTCGLYIFITNIIYYPPPLPTHFFGQGLFPAVRAVRIDHRDEPGSPGHPGGKDEQATALLRGGVPQRLRHIQGKCLLPPFLCCLHLYMYVCMYVCMGTHRARVWVNRVRLPILHVVS